MAIELKNVSKTYAAKAGQDAPAVHAPDGVGLTVADGEWLAVMGPSGSGKSTLSNLLGCLDRPTSGEIRIDGQEMKTVAADAMPRFRAEKIGFVFQQFHLIPHLTALENVMLAQYFHSMTDEKEALEALRHVGLGE